MISSAIKSLKLFLFLFLPLSYLSSSEMILFVPLEKTASVYIASQLSADLKLPIEYISYSKWPMWEIIPDKLAKVQKKRCIAREHLHPTPTNIKLIQENNIKVIFHVRDLRQIVVSFAYYHYEMAKKNPQGVLEYLMAFKNAGYEIGPLDPSQIQSWSINDFIEAHIPLVMEKVKRIDGWLNLYLSGDISMLTTTYEEFKDSPDTFYHKILEFYQVAPDGHQRAFIPRTKRNNFRKGEKQEWKRVLTPEQIQKINSMIPEYLFDFFNWEK